jgi:hypothetical protein
VTSHFPIVFEREDSGAISAYVVGLPVYAQRATQRACERAIREALTGYLERFPDAEPHGTGNAVKVAAVKRGTSRAPVVSIVSAAALVGQRTSARKAAAARANGRLGGRPRKVS